EQQSQQAVAQDDPGNWSKQALLKVQECVCPSSMERTDGVENPEVASDWRQSRYSRALLASAQMLADSWDHRLMEVAFRLMENPGRRIAAAEAAVSRFVDFCDEAAGSYRTRWREQAVRTEKALEELEFALEACLAEGDRGGWSLGSILGF